MKIKFCGIRREEDVQFCNVVEPDYMGLILSKGFRRSVSPQDGRNLVKKAHSYIRSVGVFVNASADEIADVVRRVSVDVIQLHGNETPEEVFRIGRLTKRPVWKTIRTKTPDTLKQASAYQADRLVIEGYAAGVAGGAGLTADWGMIQENRPSGLFFLAGGLTPENVTEAIGTVQPYGVDLSSGIETDGVKDFEKMKEIIKLVRGDKQWEM